LEPSLPKFIGELSLSQLANAVGGVVLSTVVLLYGSCVALASNQSLNAATVMVLTITLYTSGYYFAYNIGRHSKTQTDARIGALYSWAGVVTSFAEHMYTERDVPLETAMDNFVKTMNPVQLSDSPPAPEP
jgi:uncharacterized membrane protein